MEQKQRSFRFYTNLIPIFYGLVLLMGLLVMVGWMLHVPLLVTLMPGLAPMQFNNALCFALLGIAGISHVLQIRWSLLITSVIGFLLAFLTLIQYPLNMDFGIDLLLMDTDKIIPTAHPGRMAPNSAFGHVAAFLAFIVLRRNTVRCIRVAGWLGAMVAGAGIVSLVGYAINMEGGFNWGQYTQMSLLASIAFILAGCALGVIIIPNRMFVERSRFMLWPYEAILLITVFLIDMQIPQGVAVGLLYVMPLLAAWFFDNRKSILVVAVICNLLIVADIMLANDYLVDGKALTYNRFISFVAVWIAASIFYHLKRVSDNQRESDIRFKLAVEGTAAGLWDWIVLDGDKEWWSPQFYRLLGYNDKEIPASLETFSGFLHPEDSEYTFKMVDRHFTKRTPFNVEYRLKHKSGSYRWFHGTGQATWDDDGKPVRMVGTIIDIHSRKLAEQAEQERSAQLAQKNKELEQFTYVASHDLQEPVRTISSFATLFADTYKDNLDEEGRQYLQFIKEASERSQRLIVDLLEYGRLGKNPEMEPVDLNSSLNDVLTDLSVKVKETGATIEYDQLPTVHGRPTELRLVFQNLISNAIKFQRKDVKPKVKITVRQLETHYEFAVADNGIGIEEKYREQIFVIFRRLHGKSEYEGTGIGLAHCKKVVELHGGNIWTESTPGEGSIFYFTLPIPVSP